MTWGEDAVADTLPGLRVLVADDQRDAADTLAIILKAWGCDLQVAYDGPTALEVAPDFKPDAALLDIEMPRLHGAEVARRLRRMSEIKKPFVIAITGAARGDRRLSGYEDEFDAFLQKPCDLDELRELLNRCDGNSEQASPCESQSSLGN